MKKEKTGWPIVYFCSTKDFDLESWLSIMSGINNWKEKYEYITNITVQPGDTLILGSTKIDTDQLVEKYTDAEGAIDAATMAKYIRQKILSVSHNEPKIKVVVFTKRKLHHNGQIIRGYDNDTVSIVTLGEYMDNLYMASVGFVMYAAERICWDQAEYGVFSLPAEPNNWEQLVDSYHGAIRWMEIDEDAYMWCDLEEWY